MILNEHCFKRDSVSFSSRILMPTRGFNRILNRSVVLEMILEKISKYLEDIG